MPLSPQEVLEDRPRRLSGQIELLMGRIDSFLVERFDGGPVRVGAGPGGRDGAEVERRVFAAYEDKGWACRSEGGCWVFEPAPPSKPRQAAHKIYDSI